MRLVDVCIVVRELYNRFVFPRGGNAFPIAIAKDIVPAVQEIMKRDGAPFTIKRSQKSWPAVTLNAMLVRHQSKATIYYSARLNLCWRRFIVAKELTHLLIDKEEGHFTKDIVALGASLLTGAPVDGCNGEWDSERLAVAGAIELLLPLHFRSDIEAMALAGESDLKIATKFRLPEMFVFALLHTDYARLSKEANEGLS